MKYGFEKYKFYKHTDKNGVTIVTAIGTYAGRKIRAYAKCDPRDSFDLEKGKKLAALRCAKKIEKKRLANASIKYMNSAKEADRAEKYFNDMKQYYMDTIDQIDTIEKELTDLQNELA